MSVQGDRRPTSTERMAAVTALLAFAGSLVLIGFSAAANWEGALLATLGVFVVVTATWYAISRKGTVRTFGILMGVAGAGLFVAGVVVADLSVLRIVSTIVLIAVSVAAARYALGRSSSATQSTATARVGVDAARRPVLIMNPKSGGGKVEKFGLVEECRQRGIEPIVLQSGDDLVRLAEDAIAAGADVIGMAGGDGSQALVATVATHHGIPHVVVPAGTRNHFALDLGLDRDDVIGALDGFVDAVERRVDLATVNGRVFVNNASLGLYAKIVQSPEYREAKRRTTASMLPELLGPGAPPLDLAFVGPDGRHYETAHMILISNNPYELHHLGGRGTRKRIDLGVLGVVTARLNDASDVRRLVALEASGRIRRFEGWLEWTAPSFTVDSSGPVEIGVDGEALKIDPPLHFESIPGALRVRLPRRAIGRSPAARAVHVASRSTVADLIQISAGHPVEDV